MKIAVTNLWKSDNLVEWTWLIIQIGFRKLLKQFFFYNVRGLQIDYLERLLRHFQSPNDILQTEATCTFSNWFPQIHRLYYPGVIFQFLTLCLLLHTIAPLLLLTLGKSFMVSSKFLINLDKSMFLFVKKL